MSAKRRQVKDKSNIEWDFFSFPVLFAFSFGTLLGFLLFGLSISFQPLAFITFVASLFGTSYCVAHVISHWVTEQRGKRKREKQDEEERERRALAARAARAEAQAAKTAAAPATATTAEAPRPRRRRRRGRG